jgi:ribosomal protein L21E
MTQEELKEVLHYDPETGVFKWKVRSAYHVHVGDKAGSLNKKVNRTYIRIKGKLYVAARLAFLYTEGYFPAFVDHKDRNRTDDRKENLRAASRAENNRNMTMPSHNTSGYKGVSFNKRRNKFEAYVTFGNKKKYLGAYAVKEDAARVYDKAATELFGEFAALNFKTP